MYVCIYYSIETEMVPTKTNRGGGDRGGVMDILDTMVRMEEGMLTGGCQRAYYFARYISGLVIIRGQTYLPGLEL